MSNQYKSILLAGNAAILAGDHEGFLIHCTEDTKWEFLGDRTLQDKDAVRAWMKETYREPPIVELDHLIAEGDFLTAVGTVTMKNDAGILEDFSYCDVWRFENNKFAELKAFVIKK